MFPVKKKLYLFIFRKFIHIFFLFSSVKIGSNEGFLRSGKNPVLTVLSAGHALHVFINGQLSGGQHGFFFLDIAETFFKQMYEY